MQARALYLDVMTDAERAAFVGNIVGHASDGVTAKVRARVVDYWRAVDPDLGRKVEDGLKNAAPPAAPDSSDAVVPTRTVTGGQV